MSSAAEHSLMVFSGLYSPRTGTNSVNLTIDGANLLGTEFVSDLYFNLNTGFGPDDLDITIDTVLVL